MSEEIAVPQENDGDLFPMLRADGGWDIYARVDREQGAQLVSQGIQTDDGNIPVAASEGKAAQHMNAAAGMVSADRWPEGTLAQRPDAAQDRWLMPRLTVPSNYYTRLQWAKEYIEQESLVHSFVTRDIDQAIKRVEFQLDEKADKAKEAKLVLEKWARILNEGIQQHGGLHGYNRRSAKRLIESSLVVAIANWAPIEVGGQFYKVPKIIQNLDSEMLVPFKDSMSAVTTYYYKISPTMADKLKRSRRLDISWRQMIPDLGHHIVDALPTDVVSHHERRWKNKGFDRNFFSGPFIRIPAELVYVIRIDGDDESDYPTPTLVPIFSALAMKRKLQLADWAVADGMINMLIVFSFPAGSDPEIGKSIVRSSLAGGRVQGLSIPAQVKVEMITPPSEMLNSKDKFWVPMAEIYAHFGFPLNSESRGAGDLDSGALDTSSNAARLNAIRDPIEDLDNFWLGKIAEANKWTKFIPTVLLPRLDLDNSENFRSHMLAVYDRGDISKETLLDSVGTTVEREVARRKREKEEGIEEVLEIRETFKQTVGPDSNGRTPDAEAKPRGGAKPNRPKTSAGSQT